MPRASKIFELSDGEYITLATYKVLRGLMDLGSDGTEHGGYIVPDQAVSALMMTAAIIAIEDQPNMTPREMKQVGDECRSFLLKVLKSLQDKKAAGVETFWSASSVPPERQ